MPLTSLRVVVVGELPAGSYCARLLADFGAQVIRIEPPGGDPARGQPPLIGRGDGGADGAWFAYLNFGKSSLVLDPARAEDRARLAGLIAEADVCIDSAGAGGGGGGGLAGGARGGGERGSMLP